jgi:hypothetical protein
MKQMLDSFKIQCHAMLLDTAFNSVSTVLSNLYTAFVETATKMWTYARCLPTGKQPGTKLLISKCSSLLSQYPTLTTKETISDTIDLAFVLMKSKGKNKRNVDYKCDLSKVQVEWYSSRLDSLISKVLIWLTW